ncbi:hypothetical protein HYR54_15360 [Candidatus Acetothermia bacterium]|nr:hypothetical protein [Candidatus Acetothermia bacterium]
MEELSVNYETLLTEVADCNLEEKIQYLVDVLPDIWCDKYRAMTPTPTNILQFNDNHFEFLFDLSAELVAQGAVPEDEAVEDRVVAVFGRSQKSAGKRDASRIRGFLGGRLEDAKEVSTDKGHFMGHALGGGLDVNLFPQRSDINRGRSERGKVYRAMERYCAEHLGTFCFSRAIYSDRSWRPSQLEYGLLKKDGTLWVERFDN